MAGTTDRKLVHKVNNLITVIYTQVAVGKSAGTYEEAMKALEIIERAAQETEKVVHDLYHDRPNARRSAP